MPASKDRRHTGPYDVFADLGWQEQLRHAAQVSNSGTSGRTQNNIPFGQVEENAAQTLDSSQLSQTLPQPPIRTTAPSLFGEMRDAPHRLHLINNQPGSPPRATFPFTHGQNAPFRISTPSVLKSSAPMDTMTPSKNTITPLPASLKRIGRHDYDFRTLTMGYAGPLNFTAVEIIVFLPTLFCNSSIARRFANNGLDNTTHAEIIKLHRNDVVTVDEIGKTYLDALRPASWRETTKDWTTEQKKTLWSRKNQRTPRDWNAGAIAMNTFVPDYVAKESSGAITPPSVPFFDLMQGVKTIPSDDDAADLTRAVVFATSDQAQRLFPDRVLHFPDDLITILKIIGHTPITYEHQDKPTFGRYRKTSKERVRSKIASAHDIDETSRSSIDRSRSSSQQSSIIAYPREASSPKLRLSNPAFSPMSKSSPTSAETGTCASTPSAQLLDSFPPDTIPVRFRKIAPTPSISNDTLLRDVDLLSIPESLSLVEISRLASAIWYSCRPDQVNISWYATLDHVSHINRILEDELKLSKEPTEEHVLWEAAWEQREGESERKLNNIVTVLQQKYAQEATPYISFTASDYEDLFREPAPAYLDDLEDLTEP